MREDHNSNKLVSLRIALKQLCTTLKCPGKQGTATVVNRGTQLR